MENMSFDLGVWHSEVSVSSDEASRIYASLCRKEKPPRAITASPAIESFYQELTETWPDTQASKTNSSPWSYALQHSDDHVLLSCEWSRAVEVFPFVQQLAEKHGLVFFDPQSEEVYLPDHMS
jgi:hypothetical protein